jgi:hypothetical protein
MTLPPTSPHRAPEASSSSGTPRWVKVFGLIALVLVVAFAIVHLAGGGMHGHGRP